MGLLVVLLTALAACAVLLAPLMLPGLLLGVVVFAAFKVALHVHRRYGRRQSRTAGDTPRRASWPLVRTAEVERVAARLPRELVFPDASGVGEGSESSIGLDLVRVLREAVGPAVGMPETGPREGVCPILNGLPDGLALADRVRCGHDRKSELLQSFQALSSEVAPHNLYPVAGTEAEQVIEALSISLRESETGQRADCDLCGRVIESLAGWRQAHFGPRHYDRSSRSPRSEIVKALKSEAHGEAPSVRRVLEVFDGSVARFADDLGAASTGAERERAGERLLAAVAIHDSVESGVLCPILKRAQGGGPLAARLHEGFAFHALLQRSWEESKREGGPSVARDVSGEGAEQILDVLVESFQAHRLDDMAEVARFLEALPASAFRTRWSPLDDVLWPWHSGGAALLAIRMALWADSAPSRAHAVTLKHPSSRTLRSFTHVAENVFDHRDRGSIRAMGGGSR